MISVVWCVASLWLLPLVLWHHVFNGGVRSVSHDMCDTEYATNTTFKIATAVINFYVPLAVMIGLYTKIFIEIRRRSSLEVRQYVYAGAACKSVTAERSRREPTDLDLETEPDSTDRSSSHTNAASSLALVKVSNGNGLTSTRVGLLHTINAMAAMTTVARQRQASTTSFIFGKSRRSHRRSTQMTNLQQSFDIGDGESDLEVCCELEHKNGESFEKQRLAYDSSLQTCSTIYETIPEKDVLSNTPAVSHSSTTMVGLKPGVEPHDAKTAFTACNYNSYAKPEFYLPLVDLNSTSATIATTDSTDINIQPSNALSDNIYEHDSDSQTYHLQRLMSSSTFATSYLRQSSSATTAVTMDTLDNDYAFSPEQEIDLIDADDMEVMPAEVSDQFIQQSHSHYPLQRVEFSDSSYAGANTTNSLSTNNQIAIGDVVRHSNASTSPTRNISSPSAYQQCETNNSSDLQGTCNRLKHEHSGQTLLGKTERSDNNVKQTLTTKQTPDQTRNRGSWSLQTVFGMVQLSNVLRPRTRQSSRNSRSIDSKRYVGMETSRGSRSQATTERVGGGGGGGEGSRARSSSSGGAMSQSALLRQAMRWRKKMETSRHQMSSALAKEIKAARQLGVIVGAFTVCFFPYFVCFMAVAICINCVSSDLMTAVTWFGYVNSTLNPVLYPLCNSTFRRKFRLMLHLDRPRRDSTSVHRYS